MSNNLRMWERFTVRRVGQAVHRGPAQAMIGLLAAAVLTGCSVSLLPSQSSPSPLASGSATSATGNLDQVPPVVAKLQPSVVTLFTNGGLGSGVIYSADGLILTNEHVVRGQSAVRIAFADGQRVPGTVRAVDPVTDLALVQAERKNLPAARFQPALPTVGSLAVVIGSPLGFQNTVTAGIISGLHREIPGSARQSQALVDLIQTDAPTVPATAAVPWPTPRAR